MNTTTNSTNQTANNTGFPPVPPKAHQKAVGETLLEIARGSLIEGFATESARKSALEHVSRAFEVIRKTVMDALLASAAGKDGMDEESHKLYWAFPLYPHEWKARHQALFVARFPDAVKRANECCVLRGEIKAAQVIKRERKKTEAQVRKDALSMTCQCCGRSILAESSVIAHHGYSRPFSGYQTSSCPGARALPFEVSRERLGEHIGLLKNHRKIMVELRANTASETGTIVWKFNDYSKQKMWGDRQKAYREVTRGTFSAVLTETANMRRGCDPSFDDIKEGRLREIDNEVTAIVAELAWQEPRFSAWKQTHTREGDAWVPVLTG